MTEPSKRDEKLLAGCWAIYDAGHTRILDQKRVLSAISTAREEGRREAYAELTKHPMLEVAVAEVRREERERCVGIVKKLRIYNANQGWERMEALRAIERGDDPDRKGIR